MPLPRLALAQMAIRQGQPEKNWQTIEAYLRRATKRGAKVVVFPEDCVTGSIFGDLSKLDRTQAAVHRFQELAQKYTVDIVTGSVMEGTAEGNYNVSYYVDQTGKILARYCKNNLYHSEEKFLSPGHEAKVFQTAYGKAAIIICWDMLSSSLFAHLKQQGVEIIYCPSYWYEEIAEEAPRKERTSEARLMNALCRARASEFGVALAYVNAAGIVKNHNGSRDTLIGQTQLCLPLTGPVVHARHRRSTLLVAELENTVVAAGRSIYATKKTYI